MTRSEHRGKHFTKKKKKKKKSTRKRIWRNAKIQRRDNHCPPPFTSPSGSSKLRGFRASRPWRSRATATFLPLLYCGSSINMGERSTPCDNERVCVVRPGGPRRRWHGRVEGGKGRGTNEGGKRKGKKERRRKLGTGG